MTDVRDPIMFMSLTCSLIKRSSVISQGEMSPGDAHSEWEKKPFPLVFKIDPKAYLFIDSIHSTQPLHWRRVRIKVVIKGDVSLPMPSV